MEGHKVKVLTPQGLECLEIQVLVGAETELRVRGWGESVRDYRADNLFFALRALRLDLEREGCKLLCNAARKDAYPSRMSLEMGGGKMLYLLKFGAQAGTDDLVDVWDEAAPDQVCSVEEQRGYFESWMKSLGR